MRSVTSYRGQPLVALIAMLGGWIAIRAMVVDAGQLEPVGHTRLAVADARGAAGRPMTPSQALPSRGSVSPRRAASSDVVRAAMRSAPIPFAPPAAAPMDAAMSRQLAADQELPRNSGLSGMPLATAPLALPAAGGPGSRWSADAWLLLRRGGGTSAGGGLAAPIYGASQVGAVARYRLAPKSVHRPALYLRGSAALNGSREREVALGISARPIAGLPVAVAAEGRINHQPSGTRARVAAFAYTEMPPVRLPLAMRAELYGQAGYVGGDFATAFADGQVRIDRGVAGLGPGEVRAGGGVWGGAQRGASRLDIGPTMTLGLPLGGSAGSRLAFDWRFRVAGNAEPASGPALTLSAGF